MTVDEILFDKSFLTIFVKPEQSTIHLRWKGLATSEQFREGFLFALESIRENQIENCIANLKMMEMIHIHDEEWATEIFYPLIAATTIKKMAIITSLDFLNNAAIKRIVKNAAAISGFETRFFIDTPEATAWFGTSS